MENCWEDVVNIYNKIDVKAIVYKDDDGKYIAGAYLTPVDIKAIDMKFDEFNGAKEYAYRLIELYFK